MKSTALRTIAVTILLLVSGPVGVFAMTMHDPLLVIDFDPDKDKIEELPGSEIAKMNLPSHMASGRWWLFASHTTGGREYRIVSGYWRIPLDTEPETHGEPEADFGYVYAVVDGKYKFVAMADTLDVRPSVIGEEISSALLDDYVSRLLKAFGGMDVLQRKINEAPGHAWMSHGVSNALKRRGARIPPGMVRP